MLARLVQDFDGHHRLAQVVQHAGQSRLAQVVALQLQFAAQ